MPISGVVRAVNLLPPDLRGASKTTAELSVASEASGGAGPFIVLGVLAACVAALAASAPIGERLEAWRQEARPLPPPGSPNVLLIGELKRTFTRQRLDVGSATDRGVIRDDAPDRRRGRW